MEKKVGEKMQEEVNEKTVALCVKGGKISAEILKTAMRKFLHSMEQARSEKGKKHTRAPDQKKDVVSHGKQSIKKLQKGGSQLTNIEITEKNIKSFEKVARKYGVDYSLKKLLDEGEKAEAVLDAAAHRGGTEGKAGQFK